MLFRLKIMPLKQFVASWPIDQWELHHCVEGYRRQWYDRNLQQRIGYVERKKLKGSFAPCSSTVCSNSGGGSCSLVHFMCTWQEGTRRPGTNLSTCCLVICWKFLQTVKVLSLDYSSPFIETHPRVCMWSNSPSTLQHKPLLWNIQSDLLTFKHHLLVRTNSGSNLGIFGINSLQ